MPDEQPSMATIHLHKHQSSDMLFGGGGGQMSSGAGASTSQVPSWMMAPAYGQNNGSSSGGIIKLEGLGVSRDRAALQ